MLTVVKRADSPLDGNHSPIWECACECGNVVYIKSANLMNGNTNSCGCLKRIVARQRASQHTLHGAKSINASESERRLYSIWTDIKRRCNNKQYKDYPRYGGRGIGLCDEWQSDFEKFKNWSLDNGYTNELSIDRIDVNGNYEPRNCRWADVYIQANNKRSNKHIIVDGEIYTYAECERQYGIPKGTISRWIVAGVNIQDKIKQGGGSI